MSGENEIWREGHSNHPGEDARLEAALRNFRHSVRAWSEAEFSRPRTIATSSSRTMLRPWALASSILGLVMAVAGATSGVYVHHRHVELVRQEQARAAAERRAEQERALAAQRAADSDQLLANVDKDISREVPSALEPLAQLMDDSR